MVQKFGAYDFLANLVPGLALLWTIDWLAQFFGHAPVIPISGSLGETSILFAWGYIAGLLVQGVAQGVIERIVLALTGGFPSARWLLDGEKGMSQGYREDLKHAIHEYFGQTVEPKIPEGTDRKVAEENRRRRYQDLFYLCYNLVDQKKLSDRPGAFNAHYGLFRALFTLASLLFALFSTVLVSRWEILNQRDSVMVFQAILVFCVLAALIAFLRMQKRGEDFAKSVYDLFLTFSRQESIRGAQTKTSNRREA